MGNSQSNHPRSNYWSSGDEHVSQCYRCDTAVDDLEWVADVFNNRPEKTYIFYSFSKEPCSITVGGEAGPEGLKGSSSQTIQEGTPMIKMLRRPGEKHMCVSCFEKCHQNAFKSVALSVQGKAALVNSDYTLNRASYGSGKK